MKRLEQLDTDPAIAHAVVQQVTVFSVELAAQPYPAKGRIGIAMELFDTQRLGRAPLGIAVEQQASRRFCSLRCSCQKPSDTSSGSNNSTTRVGATPGRKRLMTAPRGQESDSLY